MGIIQGLIVLVSALTFGFLFARRTLSKIVIIGILDICVAAILFSAGLKVAAFVYLVVSLFTILLIFALGAKVINMSHVEVNRSGLVPRIIFSVVFLTIEMGLILVLSHSNSDFSSFGNFGPFHLIDYSMNESMVFVYSLIAIAASLVVFISAELFRKREIEC
ncbi:MAG: hypothetical protein KAG61_07735 [Bacteriovoracaceae bacterium]|nr:hypothetical protein [Bacteriovoracaceae bacterium]